MSDVGSPLLVRPSFRQQLRPAAVIAAAFCVDLGLALFGGVPRWIAWFGVVVFGSTLVAGLGNAVKSRGAPWELRLDADGVTVRGHDVRPWSDVAEVRVTGLMPHWLFAMSLGYRAVSFVGRPGVDLPALRSATVRGLSPGWSAAQRRRRYGTQLVVVVQAVDASTESIVDAVRRFSDVPVRGA